jgi:hypothetical protein
MSLHSLLSVTIGVPNVGETSAYYAEFGLTPGEDGWFSTADVPGALDPQRRSVGGTMRTGQVAW